MKLRPLGRIVGLAVKKTEEKKKEESKNKEENQFHKLVKYKNDDAGQ